MQLDEKDDTNNVTVKIMMIVIDLKGHVGLCKKRKLLELLKLLELCIIPIFFVMYNHF